MMKRKGSGATMCRSGAMGWSTYFWKANAGVQGMVEAFVLRETNKCHYTGS